jgi:tetratricopeptide (TPR) repeat protein
MLPPPWLRFIPYQVPNSPLLKGNSIMLLEVVPPMPPEEANLRFAQYLMTKNTPEDFKFAGQILDYILQALPGYYPALITRAMLNQIMGDAAAHRGDTQERTAYMTAYNKDAQDIYANLDKANDPKFAFEDRVNLVMLLFNTNHRSEAALQVQKCFETATEKDLRRLQMDRLLALLQIEAHDPADIKVPQKPLDFALSMLPKPLQGQILAERASVAAATNPALAIDLFHQALKLAPDFDPAASGLAKLLVLTPDPKLHHPAEALELANQVAKSSRMQSTENIQVMACAYAEQGKFDDALFYARMAERLLDNANNKTAADDWLVQIKRFENHQTFQAPMPAP